MQPSAKIIADSISPRGHRLTTIEAVMHRFVLAEFNTHRVFSRNSASSRAIPVEKQLTRVAADPAWPIAWTSEPQGMQGGTELVGSDLLDAHQMFLDIHGATVRRIEEYLEAHPDKSTRLHKSLINRLMEPFMWHTVVVTSTEWDNFFHQRASEFSPLAQPEIQATADAMLEAMRTSYPTELDFGQWHLPYIDQTDWDHPDFSDSPTVEVQLILKKVSVARCARVSYLTHDGKRDYQEDVTLFDRLIGASPMHASPLEHVATPATHGEIEIGNVSGNFFGWHQYRHSIKPHTYDTEEG
jgi:hypothetical protein